MRSLICLGVLLLLTACLQSDDNLVVGIYATHPFPDGTIVSGAPELNESKNMGSAKLTIAGEGYLMEEIGPDKSEGSASNGKVGRLYFHQIRPGHFVVSMPGETSVNYGYCVLEPNRMNCFQEVGITTPSWHDELMEKEAAGLARTIAWMLNNHFELRRSGWTSAFYASDLFSMVALMEILFWNGLMEPAGAFVVQDPE